MLHGFSFVWEKILPFGCDFDSVSFIFVCDDALYG